MATTKEEETKTTKSENTEIQIQIHQTKTAPQQPIKLIMFGLSGSGKTTILYNLKENNSGSETTTNPTSEEPIRNPTTERLITNPTTGFNVETITHKERTFTVWDMSCKHQQVWVHYLHNTYAIMFVVDANDRNKMTETKHLLRQLLEYEELKSALLLVMANKQDLLEPLNELELVEGIGLDGVTDRKWFVNPTSAIFGDGLVQGLDWLCSWVV